MGRMTFPPVDQSEAQNLNVHVVWCRQHGIATQTNGCNVFLKTHGRPERSRGAAFFKAGETR